MLDEIISKEQHISPATTMHLYHMYVMSPRITFDEIMSSGYPVFTFVIIAKFFNWFYKNRSFLKSVDGYTDV